MEQHTYRLLKDADFVVVVGGACLLGGAYIIPLCVFDECTFCWLNCSLSFWACFFRETFSCCKDSI